MADGVRQAGEWTLSVNNDATVSPDTSRELLRVAESSGDSVGSVAARMVFADRPDVINSAGIELDRLGVASDRPLGEPTTAREAAPIEVFGRNAGAALYRKRMLEEVPFDGSFFAYYEDVDVAWRARPRRLAVHVRARRRGRAPSLGDRSPRLAAQVLLVGRNRIRILARNATGPQLRRYGFAMLVFDLGYIGYALARDRSFAPVRGRLDGLRGWRVDRRAGAAARRPVELRPFLGFRAAAPAPRDRGEMSAQTRVPS